MRRAFFVLSAALAVASPSRAQQGTTREATPGDFDFLEGRWSIVYNNKTPGFPRNIPGAWVGRREAEGRVLYDEFRLALPDGSTAALGATYRVFDHERKTWDMRYVGLITQTPGGPRRQPAAWAELTAWREGEAIRVDQVGKNTRLRITYYNIAANHFSWKADLSTDGGSTWSAEHITIEATRVTSGELRWRSGSVELAGQLHRATTPGKHPLAIIVPGSGCMPLSHRFYRAHIEQLTQMGVAVFVYDKRGCGQSSGNWRDVDLTGLADDLLPILPTLAADSSVDPGRIGLWGLSQGGWVALIAAEKSSLVRHVVLLSGPPMTPAEQGDEVVALGMRQKGRDEAAIGEAVALNRRLTQVYRTDSGWEDAQAALQAAASKPWFEAAQLGMIPRDSTYWRWLRTILDYDPIPALTRLPIPILAVYGERDLLVPGTKSKAIVDSLAPTAKGPRATILVPGAGHQLRVGNGDWSDAYWTQLVGWLEKQRGGT